MKKNIILIVAVAALCFAGCARKPSSLDTDATRRYIEAWVHVQKQKHPEYLWTQTGLGAWLLEDTPGTGDPVGEFPDSFYVRVNYTYTTLAGTISGTTYEHVAQQVGTYDETSYYGPVVWYGKGLYAGLEDVLKGMKPGGKRKAMIPSWLMNFNRFDNLDGYLSADQSKNGDSGIYELELVEYFNYVNEWEVDSIGRYLAHNYASKYGTDPVKAKADSSGAHGFYYISTKAPSADVELRDTTVYINYIGRLLDGTVFDTNIRDTAIFHGVFSESRTYEPMSVEFGSSWSNTKLGGESIIRGFSRTLWNMKPFEKGTGIFYSVIGYGYRGSGSKIPAYSPLRFDIEIVAKPN
ncbi:MAG: FKBP-type peptidyl-prolyl cis-trans isomerase [Bacteroidales bacterium]|nr:FKBP-type peptidyl-prolyl cis-trans isomerase [Bacteroidales bacterium]